MRLLVIQFVPDVRSRPVPRFEPQLGTLLTLLRQRDHELDLCGLARFDAVVVRTALARLLPQLIYADISGVCADAARRTLEHVAQHEFIPVVAGGQFPSVDPEAALSLPSVCAVAVGEPDATLVTYLERLKDPVSAQLVSGVWVRDEAGLERPALAHLVEDLDSLPFPERDLFNYSDHVRRTGELEIAVGRGCPQSCAYCVNEAMARLHSDGGQWVRRRSPSNVMEEIELLRARYAGARSVRFLDHAFALEPRWLPGMLTEYAARCDLPFRCHLRANSVTEPIAQALTRAGCAQADVELISGSDFLRNEIFNMDLSAEQISDAFRHLRAASIRVRAIVYLGAPYESEAALDETTELLRKLRPDVVDVRPYYPWPGTAAAETARENGWLHPRGEEQFHKQLGGINMPACRPAVVSAYVRRLRAEFACESGEPWWRRWTRPTLFGR